MAKTRNLVHLKMKSAQRKGTSASKFISQMREAGLSYRRQDMLSDWRDVGDIEAKEGRMRYVRKDYRPTKEIAQVRLWDKMSKEYMIKVQVWSQVRPGEPLTERFVNVMSDKPLTPHEVEQAVMEKLPDWQDSIPGVIAKITPWTIIQKQSR